MSNLSSQQIEPLPTVRISISKINHEEYSEDILVVPTSSSWNDFGYRIRADIGIRTSEGTREWLDAFFALKDQMDTSLFFVKRVQAGESKSELLQDLKLPFACLLAESKSYSFLRRVVGSEQGRRILLAINDISILDSEDEDVPDWPDFFNSDVFTHAMTRSSEGHFAFRHGALIIGGRKTSGVDARQAISVNLTRQPKVDFHFDFDASNVLRGRIAIIIGKNGCGKTSSLARLAAGLATDKRQGVRFSKRPEVNQVLVFAHSGAVRLFKQRRDRSSAASVRTFALDPSTSIRRASRTKHTRLLVDIARAEDADFRPLHYFKSLIDQEFDGLTLFVPIRLDEAAAYNIDYTDPKGGQYVELRSWPGGGEARRLTVIGHVDHERDILFLDASRRPRTLSLGQNAFLNFALNALANAGPASALLIDEPENFLHPNLISRFMRLIHRVVEGTKSIAIIATHSPFVVREVQSAQVHVLYSATEDDSLEVAHPRLQTLGANVASIANEVFGDDLPEHLYELILKESELRTMPFDIVLKQFSGELSTEALMHLRRKTQSQGNGD